MSIESIRAWEMLLTVAADSAPTTFTAAALRRSARALFQSCAFAINDDNALDRINEIIAQDGTSVREAAKTVAQELKIGKERRAAVIDRWRRKWRVKKLGQMVLSHTPNSHRRR